MQRREFLQRSGWSLAALASTSTLTACSAPSTPPASYAAQNAQGHLLWQNWSGSQHAYPVQRLAPMNATELATQLAQAAQPIRPVGAGHSFNGQCATEGSLLSLDFLQGIEQHDAAQHQATVWAGTRLSQLGEQLAAIGQEMWTLPDINKQTLAGALATGTHGSGVDIPAMHGRVLGFELITVDGQTLWCSPTQESEVFHAALVGLGSFGVMTRVQLANWALQLTKRQTQVRPLAQMLQDWPALQQRHRQAEFFYLPSTGLAVQVLHDAANGTRQPRGEDQDMQALMDLKQLRDWFAWSPRIRRFLAQRLGQSHGTEVAVDHSWRLLSSERSVRFHEMEYHVPLDQQLAAFAQIVEIIETEFPEVFFPIELRTVAADQQAWLSPFYQRATGSIAIHAYYVEDYHKLFTRLEPVLRQYQGRPHWGKMHQLVGRDFAELYPQWEQVCRVRAQLDPKQRLLNPYLKTIWGV